MDQGRRGRAVEGSGRCFVRVVSHRGWIFVLPGYRRRQCKSVVREATRRSSNGSFSPPSRCSLSWDIRLEYSAGSRQVSSYSSPAYSRPVRPVAHLVSSVVDELVSSTLPRHAVSPAQDQARLYDAPLARLFLALTTSIAIVVCLLQGEALHTSRQGVDVLKRIADAPKQVLEAIQKDQVGLLLLCCCSEEAKAGESELTPSVWLVRLSRAAAPYLASLLRPSLLILLLHYFALPPLPPSTPPPRSRLARGRFSPPLLPSRRLPPPHDPGCKAARRATRSRKMMRRKRTKRRMTTSRKIGVVSSSSARAARMGQSPNGASARWQRAMKFRSWKAPLGSLLMASRTRRTASLW